MEEKERKIAEEEAMNKLVKEILKNGDVKTVFDVESKLKQSFGKVIQSMLEEMYGFSVSAKMVSNITDKIILDKYLQFLL